MRSDVARELFHKKTVHELRPRVRNAFLEPLVECKNVASGTSVAECGRGHPFTAGKRILGWK